MKVRYIGETHAISYILGKVEPGKTYIIDKEHGLELLTGLFEEVKQTKKDIKEE